MMADSYRPRERDRDYDYQQPPRDQVEVREDEGFRIRGRASMGNRSPPPRQYSKSRSPPRRQHRDANMPPRRDEPPEQFRGRGDDRRHRSPPRRRKMDGYYANEAWDPYDDPPEEPANTGEGDISTDGQPLPFLLLRGLKPNVDNELLSKGIEKHLTLDEDAEIAAKDPLPLSLPGRPSQPVPSQPGATPQSLKRVFVIRDRVTHKSLGYGFAEFHSTSAAKGAIAKARELGDAFTISSKPVSASYPHMGVFPPIIAGQSHDYPEFLFQINGNNHRYYDTRYFAHELVVHSDPPVKAKSPSPQKEPSTKTGTKRPIQSIDTLDAQAASKSKKLKSAPLAIAQQWTQKQHELRGENGESGKASDIDDNTFLNKSGTHTSHTTGIDTSSTEETTHDAFAEQHTQSFVFEGTKNGKQRKCCLLCGTNLSANVSAEDHVRRSAAHKANLNDDTKYSKGFDNLKKFGVEPEDTVKIVYKPPPEYDAPKAEYIDRAKARRAQEAKAGTTEKFKVSLKSVPQKGNKQGAATSNQPSYGMGKKLLQKAGWSDGQGLGAGNGIAAPIEQNAYAAGVGLGHESSKKGDALQEAERLTKDDRGSFLEKTKESARERFERMG